MRWVPRDNIKDALREHWITSVNCDRAAGTNYATCSCSQWRGPVRNSVGAAVNDWIAHVLAEGLNADPGHCKEGDKCVCGGDTPAVRATCQNWVQQ